MPKVGRKKFPYTKKGKTAARSHARKTGKKVKRAKYRMSGVRVWLLYKVGHAPNCVKVLGII